MPEKQDDDEYKERRDAITQAAATLKDAKTAEDVATASTAAIMAADALLECIDPAQLHQDIARHDYQGKVGDTLDTTPELVAEGKKLNRGKTAMVSALSLKANALMDKLGAAVTGAADVALRLCVSSGVLERRSERARSLYHKQESQASVRSLPARPLHSGRCELRGRRGRRPLGALAEQAQSRGQAAA